MRISTSGQVLLILAAVILSGTACSSSNSNVSKEATVSKNSNIGKNSNAETTKKPEDGGISEIVRAQAKICVEAQYNHEAKIWIDCIHPKILEAQPGGRAKMLKDLQETHALIGKKLPYDSMNFDSPKEVKTLGKFKSAVVPFQVKHKDFDDKPKTSKDFLIGVSEDEGKTWKFANSTPESINLLDKTVPGVKSLEIPKIEF